MNATLSRTLPSPKTAVPVVVTLVTAAVGSALKETQNRTCIAAWLYHTFKTCTEWSSQNDMSSFDNLLHSFAYQEVKQPNF